MLFSFGDHFHLLVDDFSGEPVNGDMNPASLFTVNEERLFVEGNPRVVHGGGGVAARLSHYIDEKVPNPRLPGVGETANGGLAITLDPGR